MSKHSFLCDFERSGGKKPCNCKALASHAHTITMPLVDPRETKRPDDDDDDGVKEPSHYALFDGIEAIEIIARSMTVEMFRGYCLGNIMKYRLRAGKKSELAYAEKDLAKANFYAELFETHKEKCYEA